MENIHDRPRPRRWRSRRLAFATTAALAGCATVARDAAVVQPIFASDADGRRSTVLFRVVAGDTGAANALSDASELWSIETGQRLARPGQLQVSRAAGQAGWRHDGPLPAGRYFLRLASPDPRAITPTDLTFTVPAEAPQVLYIGSFRIDCPGSAPCRVAPAPEDQSEAARALLAAEAPAIPAPVTRLARPYPPDFAASGLPAPAVPAIRVDTRLWLAAIDWNALTSGGALPAPAQADPDGPRSDRGDWPEDAEMASTSNMGGQIGGAIGGAVVGSGGAGAILALGVMVAIVVVVVPIVLISRAIAEDQRNRRSEAEARRAAEALRAAALAQEQWGPCAAGIAATLAPDSVERHLQARLAPQRAAGRAAALPGPWEATVSRVVFRHCGAQPDQHGVEVATRWTARRPGTAEAEFDVAYARGVAGAVPDRRLTHSERAPWELPVANEAACRPLAAYCGTAGSALLLEEVTRGVTEARDAIAMRR